MKRLFPPIFCCLICIVFCPINVLANPCSVDTEIDQISSYANNPLREIAARDLDTACSIDDPDIADLFPDSSFANAWIYFLTPEVCDLDESGCGAGETRKITLSYENNHVVQSINFNIKQDTTVVVGNPTQEMLDGTDNLYTIDDKIGVENGLYHDGDGDGKIDDLGFVLIDGSALPEGQSPFTCAETNSLLVVRNTAIAAHLSFNSLFSGCIKNGGANRVCNGHIKPDFEDGDFDPDVDNWCDGELSTAADDANTDFSPENAVIQGHLLISSFFYCKDKDVDHHYKKGIPLHIISLERQGYVKCTNNTPADDCDDANGTIHPNALETPNDGIDQDCDGKDLLEEICGDGLDNDENGLTDCNDNACTSDDSCSVEPTTETDCADGIDNDGDTTIDCDDSDCTNAESCVVADDPDDGGDDDGDGNQPATEICNDSIDNDNDGVVDCLDPDCYGVVYDEAAGLSCPVLDISAETSDAGGCGCYLGEAGTTNFSTFIMSILVGLGMIGARLRMKN